MDTDEFIVPRQQGVATWRDMLRNTGCNNAHFVSVQNVFFKKEWPDDETAKDTSKTSRSSTWSLNAKRNVNQKSGNTEAGRSTW